MKVLIISSAPYQHAESPLLGVFQKDQYDALLDQGHEVGVISPAGRSLRYIMEFIKNFFAGKPVSAGDSTGQILKNTRFNFFPRLRYLEGLFFIVNGKRLYRQYVLRYGKPDVIHAHNALYAGILAEVLWRDTAVPYLITEHSSWILKSSYRGPIKRLIGQSYINAKAVISVSNSLAKTIKDDFGLTCSIVLPNIMPVEFQRYTGQLKTPDSARPRYIHVASLDDNKNQILLLKAFSQVLDSKPGATLVIIGRGPNRTHLEAAVRDLKLDHAVEFLGALPRDEVAAQMSKSDIFLLSSFFETFGVVAIEAQAMGLPVVSTPCGGVSDIIDPGVNGQLSADFSVEAYVFSILEADKLMSALDKSALRAQALSRFGADGIASSLTHTYKLIVAS